MKKLLLLVLLLSTTALFAQQPVPSVSKDGVRPPH